jgi:hypothetical protein
VRQPALPGRPPAQPCAVRPAAPRRAGPACPRLSAGGRRHAGGAASFIATVVGLAFALSVEQAVVDRFDVPRTLLPHYFAAAFATALAVLVLAVALAAGLVLRAPVAARRAVLAAVLTATVHAAVVLGLSQLPNWRVGGGDRAMVRVALVANAFSGVVGGAAALALLTATGGPGAGPLARHRRATRTEPTLGARDGTACCGSSTRSTDA